MLRVNFFLSWLLLIFTAYPYLTFGLDFFKDNYIQPFSIITSIIISAINCNRLPINSILLNTLSFVAAVTIIIIYSIFSQQTDRLLNSINIGYLSPLIFLLSLNSYKIALNSIDIIKIRKFFIITIYIYIIVALVQLFLFTDFMTQFIGGHKVGLTDLDGGRGAISLASEPSYYAFHMLSVSSLLFLLGAYRTSVVGVLQIIFTAFSATAVGTFFLSLILYTIINIKKNIKIIFFLIFIILFFLLITPILLTNSRLNFLLDLIINNDLKSFLIIDQSSSERLYHIIYPYFYSIENLFLPSMIANHTWAEYLAKSNIIWFQNLPMNLRVMSGIGELVIIYGLFSFPLIYLFLKLIYQLHNVNKNNTDYTRYRSLFSILILIMLMGTYSLSTPIIGLIYVYFNSQIK